MDCDNSLANNESELLLNRATWFVSWKWIHSVFSRHVTDTTVKFQKLQKQTVVQWDHTILEQTFRALQRLLVERSIRSISYEIIADRGKGFLLLTQREPFFVEIVEEILHNRRVLPHNSSLKSRTFQFFPHPIRILNYCFSGGFHLEHCSDVSFGDNKETQCVLLLQVLLC